MARYSFHAGFPSYVFQVRFVLCPSLQIQPRRRKWRLCLR